jgi:hypothetical protein
MEFSNLQGASIDAKSSAVYTFWQLDGEPWIKVHPGSDINKPYFAAVLSGQSKSRRKLLKGNVDMEMLNRNRKRDRQLYPKYIDAGEWGGWIDRETGEEVPYSPEGFAELMEQLPDHLFDELRAFVNDPAEFMEEDEPSEEDIEETAGN